MNCLGGFGRRQKGDGAARPSNWQALDRLGPQDRSRNGLFTRIFLREMNKPNLTADRLGHNVQLEVVELARSVGHEQVPAIYDQMVGEFRLRR